MQGALCVALDLKRYLETKDDSERPCWAWQMARILYGLGRYDEALLYANEEVRSDEKECSRFPSIFSCDRWSSYALRSRVKFALRDDRNSLSDVDAALQAVLIFNARLIKFAEENDKDAVSQLERSRVVV